MTTNELAELFEKYEDEFIVFQNIPADRRLSNRRDLNAFLLLDKLVPSTRSDAHFDNMISAAEHDEIFLDASPKELASVATEDQIVDLIRSGLRYDHSTDSLAMLDRKSTRL